MHSLCLRFFRIVFDFQTVRGSHITVASSGFAVLFAGCQTRKPRGRTKTISNSIFNYLHSHHVHDTSTCRSSTPMVTATPGTIRTSDPPVFRPPASAAAEQTATRICIM
ncbi:unnamed protein product [Amoebophrya sp. A120]|nr:unnamed protein product [Amoebophrya sp. A120]|eukprot:GSA120T00004834001.1